MQIRRNDNLAHDFKFMPRDLSRTHWRIDIPEVKQRSTSTVVVHPVPPRDLSRTEWRIDIQDMEQHSVPILVIHPMPRNLSQTHRIIGTPEVKQRRTSPIVVRADTNRVDIRPHSNLNLNEVSQIHYSFDDEQLSSVTYYSNFDVLFDKLKAEYIKIFFKRIEKQQAEANLDYLAKKYPKYFLFCWLMNCMALITTLGYLPLVIKHGPNGVAATVNLIRSGTVLPHEATYGIGIPLGSIETLMYAFPFRANDEALKLVKQVEEKALTQRIKETFQYMKKSPSNALSVASDFTTMTIFNLSGAWSEVVGFYPYLSNYWLSLSSIIGFSTFGGWYMMLFMNDSFRKGKNFYASDKPSLLTFLKQKKISKVTEISMNAAVNLGMSAYPFYYFINQQTFLQLGGSLLTSNVLAGIAVPFIVYHRSRSVYPSIYGYAQNPEDELRDLVGLTLDWDSIRQELVATFPVPRNEKEFQFFLKKIIDVKLDKGMEQRKSDTLKATGCTDYITKRLRLLANSPLVCADLLFRSFSCIGLLINPTSTNIGFSVLFGGLTVTGYRMELERAQTVEACKVLRKELKQLAPTVENKVEEQEAKNAVQSDQKLNQEDKKAEQGNTHRLAKAGSYSFATIGAASEAFTLLGTLLALKTGNIELALLLFVAFIAIRSLFVKARFIEPMLQNTFVLWGKKKPADEKTTKSADIEQKVEQTENDKDVRGIQKSEAPVVGFHGKAAR